jgi:hypothetical protein
MPVLIKPNESKFTPAPNGPHPAACFRIVDLGTQDGSYQGKKNRKRKILISWELFSEERMNDGRPFIVGKTYTWSMSEKAGLRKDLESWRGKSFADGDFHPETGFKLQSILGKACLLNIRHDTGTDGTVYANIDSISRLPKQMTVGAPENAIMFVWLSHDEFNHDAFAMLSDRLKETIMRSPEYRAVVTGEDVKDEATAGLDAGHDPSDEIPF